MDDGVAANGIENLSGIRTKQYKHHISFRLNDADAIVAADLRATFPNNTWAETFRWMFAQPEIAEVVRRRIRGER